MKNGEPSILTEVADYYSSKLAKHGQSPQGVDWNGEESQFLRFEQLCRIIEHNTPFSINDIGCGYGALLDYLAAHYSDFQYTGIDISQDMVQAAKQRYFSCSFADFLQTSKPVKKSDYGVASGIFNVRQERSDSAWWDYCVQTLDILDRSSNKGFAFNCLTSYSDSNKMLDYLYYADPCKLFDLCKHRYSNQVALLHDYGLYEFTILVRKTR